MTLKPPEFLTGVADRMASAMNQATKDFFAGKGVGAAVARRCQDMAPEVSRILSNAISGESNAVGADPKGNVGYVRNYIGGKWVAPYGNEYLLNTNPATGSALAHIPKSGREEVSAAIQAAQEAMGPWGKTPLAERCSMIDRVADGISARHEELATLECLDTGKPRSLAYGMDVARSVDNFRFFANFTQHMATKGDANLMADAINYDHRTPLGVCSLITPWNLPLYLLTWKVAPALAMGNTLVVKPATWTPLTTTALAEIIDEAGVPPGVFNVVQGRGGDIGDAMCEDPRVAMISFTGGTDTGRRVAAKAANTFKKISLELGGKNPMIVFADADLDKVIEEAPRSAFLNQGQICLCCSRMLVQRPIYEKFKEKLVSKVKNMKTGDPFDPASQNGSVIHANQLKSVQEYIDLAVTEGGTVLCGGKTPAGLPDEMKNGAFIEPAVIDGLAIDSRVATEEVFGPLVSLHPFDTEEEAVRMANITEFGLASSVWSQDGGKAHRVAQQLETGMCWINCWLHRDMRVPFGGAKNSGVGREGGMRSLECFSQVKNICQKIS